MPAFREWREINYQAFIPKFFAKVRLDDSQLDKSQKSLLVALKFIAQLSPDLVVVQGGIHTSREGSRAYITATINLFKSWFHNLHFYGSLRGSSFNINAVSVSLGDGVFFEVPVLQLFENN